MKRQYILLAAAGFVRGSQRAFSIYDDLLAFPQYELVLSDEYIGDAEADFLLSSPQHESSSKSETPLDAAPRAEGVLSELGQPIEQENPPVAGDASNVDSAYQHMVLESKPYLCVIPKTLKPNVIDKTDEDSNQKDEEKELVRATRRGWELLKDMEGHCMYFVSGWWSYSFCYNNEVKQFHALPPGRGSAPVYPPVEDDGVPSFVLGSFKQIKEPAKQIGTHKESPAPKDSSVRKGISIKTKGELRYMVQNLTGGTICDLTDKPRKIEVQFHCHPQSSDRIGWIKEIATCSYLMVIYTPRLCNDVAFLPPKETQAHQIVCKEVVQDSHLEAYRARRKSEATIRLLSESSKEPARPVVGGIVVGGMKQVGQEGKLITPPKPVEQADETGEIIAKWDPARYDGRVQKLSDSDLRKMDLDPLVVRQMREELHKKAAGKVWKLEVVEIGGGMRELHGIVEGDDDLDESPGEEEYHEKGDHEGGGDDKDRKQKDDRSEEKGSREVFKDEL